MSPILTIVVCTYNRSEWLAGCLSSLESQCNDRSVEVLVVDNNSTDATSNIAHSFSNRLPNYCYIFEAEQGLSHARNRGYREAKGQIVAYIDDDARANPDWANAIIRFFQDYPNASGVGGQHKAFSSVPIPEWFPEEYGSRSLGEETRVLQKGEWISGLNMAFKKSALIEIGGFDTSIGMTGEKVSYGEETQLTLRMLGRGMEVYYCPKMQVEHAILPHKLKLRWLLHSNYANGYDGVSTFNYSGSAMNYLPKLSRSFVRTLTLFVSSKEKYIKTRIYRSMASLFWDLGFFVRLMGL
jgi:glycosyltransferase involved in cell wall biosynthesis